MFSLERVGRITRAARYISEGAKEPSMASNAYVNKIATAVPDYEINQFFVRFAASMLAEHPRRKTLFDRMIHGIGIEQRYTCFAPAGDPDGSSLDLAGTFVKGGFPGTASRMRMYEQAAPDLAQRAVEKVLADEDRSRISHLIVTSCTGFSAPGIDL